MFVLNTCSVTERADRECRQIIRRTLRHSPDAFVIVIGCYAQLQPQEIASISGVDLVLGAGEKFHVFEHAGEFRKGPVSQVFVSCIDDAVAFDAASSAEGGGRTRAFLKIQDGCNYRCSFCTIPLARGVSRSQPSSAVLQQARSIADQGYKEVVLTGVNVGDYGTNNGDRLLDLMKQLDRVDGLERIRISSIEPNLLTMPMIDFIFSSKKFCNHFHIPLQSGSNTILKQMRRRYCREHYRELVDHIRRIDPDAGIGVDVIAGFPGETRELFGETYKFLVDLPVAYMHVFTYSERENTPAVLFGGAVDPKERFQRSEMLRLLSRRKRSLFHESFIGSSIDVLFESKTDRGTFSGLTTNYLRVEAPVADAAVNEILQVNIRGFDRDVCLAQISATSTSERHRLSKLVTVDETPDQSDLPLSLEYR